MQNENEEYRQVSCAIPEWNGMDDFLKCKLFHTETHQRHQVQIRLAKLSKVSVTQKRFLRKTCETIILIEMLQHYSVC